MFIKLLDKFVGLENLEKKKYRDKAIRLTGIFGLILNIFLFIIKIIIGFLTGSISIISDAFNNLSDCLTSLVAIVGSYLSGKPADEEHPYGHGRTEYIVTMVVGMFIVVCGFQLLVTSFQEILNPTQLRYSPFTIVVLFIAIVIKFYMYIYNTKISKLCKSELNKALSIDSLNDVIATTIVLLSNILYKVFNLNIDGFVGLVVAFFILKTGYELFIKTGYVLLGTKIDDKKYEELKQIILSGKYIKGVHKIEVHEYGHGRYFGSCHVEAPANIDVFSMHSIIHKIEEEVYEKTNIRISIHIDPKYLLERDRFKKIEDESILEEVD